MILVCPLATRFNEIVNLSQISTLCAINSGRKMPLRERGGHFYFI
jgi:hypothetical protein